MSPPTVGDKGLAVQEALADELGLAQPEIAWHTERDRIRQKWRNRES